ncbi:MAG: tetratricopeptide repeat protein [Patescibacteria group bacterium]
MWYLIIPPVIVVVSLAFVLWYLSRKGADPSVAEKMAHLDTLPKRPSFSRTKAFFLRLLEKMVQRSKVSALRMHNGLNQWTQSLKEKRRRVQETVTEESRRKDALREVSQEALPASTFGFLRRKEKATPDTLKEETFFEESIEAPLVEAREESGAPSFESPIIRRRKILSGREQQEESEASPESRPMVSARLTRPESALVKPKRSGVREEDLIKRIANNPKDFTAYEALGDYYLEADNIKDAKECYRQVLKLSPVQRMVKIKIRRLEKLLAQKS